MKLTKKLSYSALNIVTHPHSQQTYIELFFTLKKQSAPVKLRGDTYATVIHISYFDKQNKSSSPVLGEIVKYTNIDKDADWYDINSQDIASDEDLEKIKDIPDHLKPNMSKFSFIFYPDTHLLVFESLYDGQTFSAHYAKSLFESLFASPSIANKFGNVEVTIVPETDTIDSFLSLSGLKCLRMVTNRPNPDQLSKTEGKIKSRLAKINAISEERILKADREAELLLDEITKLEAKVAAKNGEVEFKRKNESGHIEVFSTKEHPLKEDNFYNPAISSAYDELIRVGATIKQRVKDWIS
ncbi:MULTISPECIES: DUF4747 family protein [Vibrio]|uniref:DUF4747 family protein n=1 Tax=Vibrio TaxID=662 RepID=UPI0001543A7A|nr:DUF4747 family protein [Vibrio sp. B1FIG11]EDL69814.1 conserved hypothetical protein [Vibrio campbellii HY01]CAD7823937.1 hypothetical protein ACOMICROBIO_LMKGKHOH_05156 [Vibrio sp. B1FIG11]CAE6951011.1 hypothetical protein ACOMICROBIO_LMKGKHOH_05156 [Vibrio sp. B1FIG11]